MTAVGLTLVVLGIWGLFSDRGGGLGVVMIVVGVGMMWWQYRRFCAEVDEQDRKAKREAKLMQGDLELWVMRQDREAQAEKQRPIDLTFIEQGTTFLLRATSPAGEAWIAEHIGKEAKTSGDSVVIECKFITSIAAKATMDGLKVA